MAADPRVELMALYGLNMVLMVRQQQGHMLNHIHPELGIPVYSLYGPTRKPTAEMLANVDVLLFDIRDIGARTYTYISTLNYCQLGS